MLNTFVFFLLAFTKALAEAMLLKEAGNLPVAIVRPSIGMPKFIIM